MARTPIAGSLFALLMVALGACAAGPSPSESPANAGAATASETTANPPEARAESGSESAPSDEPLPDGMYRILLTRPDRVGARARVRRVTTDVRSTRMLENGRQVDRKTAERRVQLEATSEVLAIGADGRATKTRYVVERLEAQEPKGPRKIVPSGTEVTVVRAVGTPGELRIGSDPLDDASLDAVKAVLPTTLAKHSEHHVFGSDTPRAIGDSWPIDEARARAGIQEVGIVPKGKAKGTTRVVEKRNEGGEECLFVLGQLELDRFDMPGMPAGAQTKRAQLRMRFTGAYPLDLTHPVRKQQVSISMQVHATARKSGKNLEMVVDSQRESQTEVEPL